MNGLPAIRFYSVNINYLTFARPVQDDFTIFCVYRSSQGAGTGTQFYQGAGLVNGEMANANYDGIDEVYFELDVPFDQATVGVPLVIDLDGHVALGMDTERPYSGHMVNVEATLTLERLGRHCFAKTDFEILKAALDYGWSDPDPEDVNQPPLRTLTQALAEELGIEQFEAAQLADAKAQELTGHIGNMTYGYVFDFTDYASPQLADKLLEKNGSLQFQVGSNFFEGLVYDGWPK